MTYNDNVSDWNKKSKALYYNLFESFARLKLRNQTKQTLINGNQINAR